MKVVSLVITAILISLSAPAQTNRGAAPKKGAATVQQKAKKQGAKTGESKAADKGDVTRLSDERAYKAKWSFEQMLQRRLEINAAEAENNVKKDD